MKFTVAIYESRNTLHYELLEARNWKSAKNKAQELSKTAKFPIMVESQKDWVKYEKGEPTEWSLNAFGPSLYKQIKAQNKLAQDKLINQAESGEIIRII